MVLSGRTGLQAERGLFFLFSFSPHPSSPSPQPLPLVLADTENTRRLLSGPTEAVHQKGVWRGDASPVSPPLPLPPPPPSRCIKYLVSSVLSYTVPGEIKRREVELDPQVSPEEIMSREVELGCESWTSFASGCSSTAVQRTLSL